MRPKLQTEGGGGDVVRPRPAASPPLGPRMRPPTKTQTDLRSPSNNFVSETPDWQLDARRPLVTADVKLYGQKHFYCKGSHAKQE